MSFIEKHLRSNMDKLRFIELPKEYFEKCNADITEQKILVPIFIDYLESMILNNKKGISIHEVLKSMAYLMGLDKEFKYNKIYLKIIESYLIEPMLFFSSCAKEEYDRGEYRNSIIILSCIIHFYDNSLNLLFNYATLCKEMIDRVSDLEEKEDFYKEAKRVLKIVVKHDNSFAMAQYQLGFFYLNDHAMKEAKQCFQEAKKYIPQEERDFIEDIDIQLQKIENNNLLESVRTKLEVGEVESSIDLLKKFNPSEDTELYEKNFLLGFAFSLQENYEMSIDCYSKCLEIDNSDVRIIAELALCFAIIGDFEQSKELYLSALDLSPNSIELLCNLSMVCINLNKFDLAGKYIREALELDDKDEIALSIWNEVKSYL